MTKHISIEFTVLELATILFALDKCKKYAVPKEYVDSIKKKISESNKQIVDTFNNGVKGQCTGVL